MLGAIAGDVIGSVYEFHPVACHWDEFPLFTPKSCFTDETVMTVAVAQALSKNSDIAALPDDFIDAMHAFGKTWPKAGYGGKFAQWLKFGRREPYNSFGNGSAMRVSPVGWIAKSLDEAEKLAEMSAAVTHNHPEGIKGAQATAGAIFLARQGKAKSEIRDYVTGRYAYDLNRTLDQIRQTYRYDITCQGTVPEAIIAFLESGNFEEAVRKAIWLRGDADTLGAITGGIAEAFYGGVPEPIAIEVLNRLDAGLLQGYGDWIAWVDGQARNTACLA